MSSVPQTTTEEQMPPIQRKETVYMGRQDYLSTLFRLTGAELYKIQRRTISKVLSLIAICAILGGFLISALPIMLNGPDPASGYLPPPCTATTDPTQACLDHTPTQADLNQAESLKRENLRNLSSPLHLPGSFITASQIAQAVGLILIVILAGTIVGGEYGAGTIRVIYTRGPTRTQFLLAKALTLLACIVLGVAILLIVGIILGAILNLISGQPVDFSFFTIIWLLHAMAYFGIVVLGLMMYALIALSLSTLGRTTAAGLAGGLVWWGLESVLGGVFVLVSSITKGATSNIFKAIPDYFIGNNISSLLANQDHALTGAVSGTIPDLQAGIVLLVYIILFFGSAWLVNRRRDVTN
jgi:ABC-type transport system involved in multi-copper enzyme maturation permease subunit